MDIVKRAMHGIARIPEVGDALACVRYRRSMGMTVSLRAPRRFSEQLTATKRLRQATALAPFIDKWEVRDYVKARIGAEHLIPAVGVVETAEELTFHMLDRPVAVKATHASSYNWFHRGPGGIGAEALAELRRHARRWLAHGFDTVSDELNYRAIRRRVVVEHLLGDATGSELPDYKFFCFYGVPLFLQLDTDRFVGHHRTMLDLEWRQLPFDIHTFARPAQLPQAPGGLARMAALAARLSAPFPFVRVDLYEFAGQPLFGELTFTPGAGIEPIRPVAYDAAIGGLLRFADTRGLLARLAAASPAEDWATWVATEEARHVERRAMVAQAWREALAATTQGTNR